MTDWQAITTKSYDNSATALAQYFSGMGPRTIYINLAFKLIGNKENANVVEIGCGDGRDATEILKHSQNYIGFDPSKAMIEIAKKNNPKASFEVSDSLSFDYPKDADIVFAFASLLHVNRQHLAKIIKNISDTLNSGGLLYISLKERDHYQEEVKEDAYGRRMFYFYTIQDVLKISSDYFIPVIEIHETIGHTRWFELGLKRK